MESVHHLMKVVSGAPNIRPAWFFDTVEQGEGLNDIGTHLVDLVQWTLFPGRAVDYRSEIKVLAAQRWPTVIPESEFQRVTGGQRFGPALAPSLEEWRARILRQHAGVVRRARRPCEAECDLGLGSTAGRRRHAFRVLSRHAGAHRGAADRRGSVPPRALRGARLAGVARAGACGHARGDRVAGRDASGHRVEERGSEIHVTVPPALRDGHEAHFAQVAANFLRYVRDRRALPAWERPNMLAKYYVTTTGTELSRKSPARAAARIAPR